MIRIKRFKQIAAGCGAFLIFCFVLRVVHVRRRQKMREQQDFVLLQLGYSVTPPAIMPTLPTTTGLPMDQTDTPLGPIVMNEARNQALPGRIPHILHLVATWEGGSAPENTIEWIRSWERHNPTWDIWLWTAEAARMLVAKKWPHYLSIYDGYPQELFRADAIRYIIIYEYGGIYADLDMECLKPLDPIADTHTCLLSQDPEAHRVFEYKSITPFLTNAFMACQAGHPLFKTIIEKLPANSQYARTMYFPDSSFWATGPKMLIREYYTYYNETHDPSVSIAPSDYFHPRLDDDYKTKFCQNTETLGMVEKAVCMTLNDPNFVDGPKETSYTDHHWLHSYTDKFKTQVVKFVRIKEVVPSIKDAYNIVNQETGRDFSVQ